MSTKLLLIAGSSGICKVVTLAREGWNTEVSHRSEELIRYHINNILKMKYSEVLC